MMNEVYFGNKPSDRKAVARLLSMTGGDTFITEQKYKDSVSARIAGLFVMSTNELPDLANVGSALSARLLPLVFSKSFVGSEDVNLATKFDDELPGMPRQRGQRLGRTRHQVSGLPLLPHTAERRTGHMRHSAIPGLKCGTCRSPFCHPQMT